MPDSAVSVDVLVAECGRIEAGIAEHRAAIAALVSERNAFVVRLRGLGLSERGVGRLLGISGVRVHQILAAPPVVWAEVPREPLVPEFVQRAVEAEFTAPPAPVAQVPVKRTRKVPVAAVQSEPEPDPGPPSGRTPCCKHCTREHGGHADPCTQGCR
jgi:hypothetical protein